MDISERPQEVNARQRFGDLEVDTVMGANHKGALLTIVDRLTEYIWIRKLDGKNATELAGKLADALLPCKPWLHTIPAYNGKEFAEHQAIARAINILFFFARPYRSWERGANENAKGLIRKFFPKKTALESITQEQVQRVEHLLNNRPIKRLGFLALAETVNKILFNKKVAFAA